MILTAQDLDLLGFGDGDPQLTLGIFKEIGAVQADDGVMFDTDRLEVGTVRVVPRTEVLTPH
ncbi:hypothetical protein [Bradyrhizobium zhanjiangense]|uniref:Uncharacterized protein n=1 Tax=Bradyrhizobium zhanjiangense TaxID=1325107 RepID=A0A4Q0Q763_9BRAD|nr:hypothetical protein [Bradyrhizobium zhanjiangense]RXG85091.1 hypothetical protein EAS61_37055 [Bradyrhizobium zhanjiangense]